MLIIPYILDSNSFKYNLKKFTFNISDICNNTSVFILCR